MNTITTDIKSAIISAHNRAEQSTQSARDGMEQAISDRIVCAALVEKAKEINKDIHGFLSDTQISAQQVKAYLSLHDAAQKRPAMHDKRQLLLCGILDTSDVVDVEAEKQQPTKQPASVISSASNFIGKFNKIISRRPVDEWSADEKQQVKDVLQPIRHLWDQL